MIRQWLLLLFFLSYSISNTCGQIWGLLPIRIVLAGLNGDPPRHMIEESKLRLILENGLPVRTQTCLETLKQLNVSYNISYEIVHDEELLHAYENILEKTIVKTNEQSYVDSQKFESLFRDRTKDNTIFVMNPDIKKIGIRGTYQIRSCSSPYGGQLWIGPGRYVVIDLSATPVSLGPASSEGIFTEHAIPSISKNNLPGTQGRNSISTSELQGSLSALVFSAINHVFAPDLAYCKYKGGEIIFLPIIVLKDHVLSTLDSNSPAYIDLDRIKREVESMFEGITVPFEVVMHEEFLHNHKQISMAVYQSLRWHSFHHMEEQDFPETNFQSVYKLPTRRPFLDSRRLSLFLTEIKADPFAESLMTLSRYNAMEYNPLKARTTRILPIYVFSLFHQDPYLTLENFTMVEETPETVLVLQTNFTKIPIPFLYQNKYVMVNGLDTTRHIIAGILSMMGGVMSPVYSVQSIQDKIIHTDFSWAFGYHPFGHYSTCKTVSLLFTDASLHNIVVSNIDEGIMFLNQINKLISTLATAFLYTESGAVLSDYRESLPFWTDLLYTNVQMPQVKMELQFLEERIVEAVIKLKETEKLLQKDKFHEAFQLSLSFREFAINLFGEVESELLAIEETLLCCYVHHALENPFPYQRYAMMILISFIIFMFLWYIVNPNIRIVPAISMRIQGTRSSGRSSTHRQML